MAPRAIFLASKTPEYPPPQRTLWIHPGYTPPLLHPGPPVGPDCPPLPSLRHPLPGGPGASTVQLPRDDRAGCGGLRLTHPYLVLQLFPVPGQPLSLELAYAPSVVTPPPPPQCRYSAPPPDPLFPSLMVAPWVVASQWCLPGCWAQPAPLFCCPCFMPPRALTWPGRTVFARRYDFQSESLSTRMQMRWYVAFYIFCVNKYTGMF